MIHFDTSFVVDFLREGTRGEVGPARALFKKDGAHLVTRDSKDFLEVPRLEVISY